MLPMKAAYYESFRGPIQIQNLPDPSPAKDGVVLRIGASGICRSDWHGWMGHDGDISLPHVPGHELAGEIVAVGAAVRRWTSGDRVTVPFALGCGACPQCSIGNQHICDQYWQPGFTAWGSFAEYVAIRYADENLVRLPEGMGYTTAAVLGCRFITSFRAIVAQAQVQAGDWVAVHGCGGVGLSAIMIANAIGAKVIAIDIDDSKLEFAQSLGAAFVVNARKISDIPEAIKTISNGGVQVSVDALGSRETCRNSILSLRKRGKHIQVGLLLADQADPPLPMASVIANELEIIGSHGMQAHQYPRMWEMINAGKLQPEQLLGRQVSLEEAVTILQKMNQFEEMGVTVLKF